MRKTKVRRTDGGVKSVNVTRVGLVVWNGATGELKIEAEEAYMAATRMAASLMLLGDHAMNVASVRAELYPVYGNENVVQIVLVAVSMNAGEVKAHEPNWIKPKLADFANLSESLGLLAPLKDDRQLALVPDDVSADRTVQ